MVKKQRRSLPGNVALDSQLQKQFIKKVKTIKKNPQTQTQTKGSGVVYIGHIPHGFYERQMKNYFAQFGQVKRLRISRSKKTGGIKGYAFVQFVDDFVAKVVADSMNNYLMFHKLLKCEYVPITRLHPKTFKGCGRNFRPSVGLKASRNRHNQEKTNKKLEELKNKAIRRKARSLKKLGELGIDFEYPGLVKISGQTANVSTTSVDIGEQTDPDPSIANTDPNSSIANTDPNSSIANTVLDSSIFNAAKSFLLEDSDEDEIEFPRTPPGAGRKSLSDFCMTPKAALLQEAKIAYSATVLRRSKRKRKAQSPTPAKRIK